MITERNRTPIILGIIAGVLLVAVVIALSIYLMRGASSPDAADTTPASTEQAPPAPAPTATDAEPEPTEAAEDPTGVALGATGFTLRDADGEEVFTFAWGDDTAEAVAALTEAFGAAPEERTEDGNGSTYPDYTVYQWSGFALYDMVATAELPRDEYTQPSYLRYTANTVGDIAITAEFDLAIGAAVDELDPADEWDRGSGSTRIVFEPDRSGFAGGSPAYSALADTDGEVVTAILYYYYSGH